MTNLNVDLSRCPIFSGLTPEQLLVIENLCEKEQYAAGDTIIREGEEDQNLWVILMGRCEVTHLTSHRGEQSLATIETHSVFGEMSFFNRAPHSASVKATVETHLLRFPRAKFDQLCEERHTTAHKILANTVKILADRLRAMDRSARDFAERASNDDQKQEWSEFRSRMYGGWEF